MVRFQSHSHHLNIIWMFFQFSLDLYCFLVCDWDFGKCLDLNNYSLSKLYNTGTKYLKPHIQEKLEVKRPSLRKYNKANFASIIAKLYFHRLNNKWNRWIKFGVHFVLLFFLNYSYPRWFIGIGIGWKNTRCSSLIPYDIFGAYAHWAEALGSTMSILHSSSFCLSSIL